MAPCHPILSRLSLQLFYCLVSQIALHLLDLMPRTPPCNLPPHLGEIQELLFLLDPFQQEEQVLNLDKIRGKIAASIACHAAIKINMPLEQNKMEWLLKELAKTECPMSCPHGRPVVLRYSVKEIQKAFKRI